MLLEERKRAVRRPARARPGSVILPSDAVQTAVISADQTEQASSERALRYRLFQLARPRFSDCNRHEARYSWDSRRRKRASKPRVSMHNGAAQIAGIQAGCAREHRADAGSSAGHASELRGANRCDLDGRNGIRYERDEDTAQTAIAAQQVSKRQQAISANQTTASKSMQADQARSAAGDSNSLWKRVFFHRHLERRLSWESVFLARARRIREPAPIARTLLTDVCLSANVEATSSSVLSADLNALGLN